MTTSFSTFSSGSRARRPGGLLVLLLLLVVPITTIAACAGAPSDQLSGPSVDACRQLTISDLAPRTNDTPVVACTQPHTAQTFFVGTFPATVGKDYAADAVGGYAYQDCMSNFVTFLGASDSLIQRIQLSWAWFGPSPDAWKHGARWFRCDAVGTPPNQSSIVPLPATVKDLFKMESPDRWLTCATGTTFASRKQVSCDNPHTWRAVTAIKLGQPRDPYPGDHISAVRAQQYCSEAIGAYFNYASDYEFASVIFHAAEWKVGNRRAVCWAKTTK